MSYPFEPKPKPLSFSALVEFFRSKVAELPDHRVGLNTLYTTVDTGIGALSVFFTQIPSFSEAQRTLWLSKDCNNTQTLFGMTQIPSDNQIRNLLDPVPREYPLSRVRLGLKLKFLGEKCEKDPCYQLDSEKSGVSVLPTSGYSSVVRWRVVEWHQVSS
jgi:hypothetical protein